MRRSVALCIFLLILLSGCTTTRTLRRSETNAVPAKLAVLPVDNYTNDVAGAVILRQVVYKILAENYRGYDVQRLEKTDELLREAGITDGGQISVLHPIEVSEILEVDGLLYLKLSELELLTLPFYTVRRVDMTYSIYTMGKLLTEVPLVIVNRFIDVEGIIQTFEDPDRGAQRALAGMAIGQGVRFATAGIAEHELKPEMDMAARELTLSLPVGMANDRGYVDKIEEELKKLRMRVDEGMEISPEQGVERERVEVEVTEGGITVF